MENVVTDSIGNEISSKSFFALAAVITAVSAGTFVWFKKKSHTAATPELTAVK